MAALKSDAAASAKAELRESAASSRRHRHPWRNGPPDPCLTAGEDIRGQIGGEHGMRVGAGGAEEGDDLVAGRARYSRLNLLVKEKKK